MPDAEFSMTWDDAVTSRLVDSASAQDFRTDAASALAGIYATGPEAPHRPYGADPRNESAALAARMHEDAARAAQDLLAAVDSGMRTTAAKLRDLHTSAAEVDRQTAADVDRAAEPADDGDADGLGPALGKGPR